MSRINLPELDDVERLLATSVLHFDEESARAGNLVVGESRKLVLDVNGNGITRPCSVELTEDDEIARLKRVILKDLDKDSLVIKPDNFGIRWNRPHTWNKACDYLVLTKCNDKKYAIFIELKTNIYEDPTGQNKNIFSFDNEDDKLIAWQMLGGDLLYDCLLDTVRKKTSKNMCRAKDGIKKALTCELMKYQRRYVIFYLFVDKRKSSGVMTTATIHFPNVNALEKSIRTFHLEHDNEEVSLGALLTTCLEAD